MSFDLESQHVSPEEGDIFVQDDAEKERVEVSNHESHCISFKEIQHLFETKRI